MKNNNAIIDKCFALRLQNSQAVRESNATPDTFRREKWRLPSGERSALSSFLIFKPLYVLGKTLIAFKPHISPKENGRASLYLLLRYNTSTTGRGDR